MWNVKQICPIGNLLHLENRNKLLLIQLSNNLIEGALNMVKTLKALADTNRMKIVEMLLSENLCVGALAGRLVISKPAVSQHIQVLRRAGLIQSKKRGYWTHYAVNRKAIKNLAEDLDRLSALEKQRPLLRTLNDYAFNCNHRNT